MSVVTRVSHGRLFDQLRDLATGIHFAAVAAISAAVDAGTSSAKGTTLFEDKTGALRKSIVGKKSGLDGTIVAGTPTRVAYAAFVESGTHPHVITVKNASVLAFMQNGRMRFARSVNHPGTAPRPFMYEARRVASQTLEYGAEHYIGEAIRRYAR